MCVSMCFSEVGTGLSIEPAMFLVCLIALDSCTQFGNLEPLHAAPVFARHINLKIVDDRTIYVLNLSKGSGGFQK